MSKKVLQPLKNSWPTLIYPFKNQLQNDEQVSMYLLKKFICHKFPHKITFKWNTNWTWKMSCKLGVLSIYWGTIRWKINNNKSAPPLQNQVKSHSKSTSLDNVVANCLAHHLFLRKHLVKKQKKFQALEFFFNGSRRY